MRQQERAERCEQHERPKWLERPETSEPLAWSSQLGSTRPDERQDRLHGIEYRASVARESFTPRPVHAFDSKPVKVPVLVPKRSSSSPWLRRMESSRLAAGTRLLGSSGKT